MDPLSRPLAALAAGLAAVPVIAATAGMAAVPVPAARPLHAGVPVLAAHQVLTMPAGGRARTLTLITGGRLAVTRNQAGAGPAQAVSALPGARAGALISVGLRGASYEIPYDAMPYLGHGLDPRLFSVTALLRAEKGGRIPVQVAYRGRVPAVAGVTFTRAAAGTASGYLTASSARIFGAALARQFAADRNRGGLGTDGLFGNGMSIRLAGSPASAARSAQPETGQVPLGTAAPAAGTTAIHTLTFRARDWLGRPDNFGTVVLVNADDSSLLKTVNTFFRGTATFTVPDGHYFATAFFQDHVTGIDTGFRFIVVPQITVSADMTVRTDALTASSKVTMVTPRPAVPQETTFEVGRVPASGAPAVIGVFGGLPLRVRTTSTPPSVGKMQIFVAQTLTSPAWVKSSYEYNLSYQDLSGIIRPQRYQIQPASLAAVQARFDSAAPMNALLFRAGEYPAQIRDLISPFFLTTIAFLRLPARLTEYFTGDPSLVWSTGLYRWDVSGALDPQQSDVRGYRAGQRVSEGWNAYPLHPAPDVNLLGASAAVPVAASASRAGNVLTMLVTPFSDNVPGHAGGGIGGVIQRYTATTGRFTVYQNGNKIAGGDATRSLSWQAPLSSGPSVIRFVLDASRTGRWYPLSTQSHTEWTWRSAPEPGVTLPAGWTCPSFITTSLADRHCAAQPLLSLTYSLAGLTARGSAPAGRQSVTITAGHFQPSASTAQITHVRVRVSYDNGRTWHTATITRTAPGSYHATYTAPPSARYVMLNVTAADTSGSTISETLQRAYQITG